MPFKQLFCLAQSENSNKEESTAHKLSLYNPLPKNLESLAFLLDPQHAPGMLRFFL